MDPKNNNFSKRTHYNILILIVLTKGMYIAGFRSRSREPDGNETLRHPVDILLLELMKADIF